MRASLGQEAGVGLAAAPARRAVVCRGVGAGRRGSCCCWLRGREGRARRVVGRVRRRRTLRDWRRTILEMVMRFVYGLAGGWLVCWAGEGSVVG